MPVRMKLCFQVLSLWFFENKHICSKGLHTKGLQMLAGPQPLWKRLHETSCLPSLLLKPFTGKLRHGLASCTGDWARLGWGCFKLGRYSHTQRVGARGRPTRLSPPLCRRLAVWPWNKPHSSLNLAFMCLEESCRPTQVFQTQCEDLR